ncbi:hypothetical protein [Bacillus sp. AK031]
MLIQGIYEEIITKKLQEELSGSDLDFDIGKSPLDVEEARKVISFYRKTGYFNTLATEHLALTRIKYCRL